MKLFAFAFGKLDLIDEVQLSEGVFSQTLVRLFWRRHVHSKRREKN